jgi:hypothetical protein
MNEKTVVNITTENVKGIEDWADDVFHFATLGLLSERKLDHVVATVTYSDGSVNTGRGATKDEAIREATKAT